MADQIDFADVAEQLAKAARFCGATTGKIYSVAEHCCRGADAIMNEGGAQAQTIAAYFLLHDAHEAYLGDDTTPKKYALAEYAADRFGDWVAQSIAQVLDGVTYRLDRAISHAAGLPWPPEPHIKHIVKRWDDVMFETEWRDLIKYPQPYERAGKESPLPEIIGARGCWPWETARAGYLTRCRKLLPALRAQAECEASP